MARIVTKEEFYKEIREKKLNVYVSCSEDYPYTNHFKFPGGVEWGRIEPIPEEGKHPYFWKERYIIF